MREAVRRVLYERPLFVVATLMAAHLAVMALAFDPAPHGGGDNTAYLALARSLLDGRYVELWDPARPPHTQYPPGFPALLAVAWTLGLRSWVSLKLLMVGFSAVAIGVSYLWMRHRVEPITAAGLGLVLAVAPGLAAEGQWVLSDVPFWAAVMAALLAAERRRTGWAMALAFLALSLRTAALPLLAAMAVWLGLQRRWKSAAGLVLGVAAVAALWLARGAAVESNYLAQLLLDNPYVPEAGRIGVTDLLERVAGNADRYGLRILMRSLTGGVGLVAAVGGLALLLAAAVGLVRRATGAAPGRSERSGTRGLVEAFTVLYLGMLLVWPRQWASDRFLLPLLPVLLAYAAEGVNVLPGPRNRAAVRVGAAAALVGLAVPASLALWDAAASCRAQVRVAGIIACRPPEHQAFLALARWSRDRLPEDAVVISRKPRQWYWFGGRPGRTYPFSLDPDRLLEEARDAGARYVVLDDLGITSEAYLVPAVGLHRHQLCLLQRMGREGGWAALLGILETAWDPGEAGLQDALRPDDDALRLPLCPPSYREAW